jgi:hypothetical protein
MGKHLLDRLNFGRSTRIAAFWTAYALITLVAGAIYVRVVPSSDQSIFDYLAWLNIHGVPYYKGSFDMTWPGQLVFHELSIRLFGVHPWTTRAGDFILLQPAVLAIYLFLRRAGFPKAAVVGALAYPIIYVTSGPWVSGHRDITGAHFLIGAAIFALPSERRSAWALVIAGLLVGYATMIRPTYLAFAPMLFLITLPNWQGAGSWMRAVCKQALLFGAGLVVPPLAFVLYGVATGTLYDWYIDSVRFVVAVYPVVGQSKWRLFPMAANFLVHALWWLVIAAVLGGILWSIYGRSRRALWLLAAMLATFFVSYFVQNKGFGYHLAGLIPVLFLIGLTAVEAIARRPLRTHVLENGLAAVLALLLTLGVASRLAHAIPRAPDWGRQEQDNPLRVADAIAFANIIRTESAPDDTMLQWSKDYQEYQVSYLSERRSPIKYFNVNAVRLIRPSQPVFGDWLLEIDRNLRRHPPKFILVDQTVLTPGPSLPTGWAINDVADASVRRTIAHGYAVRDHRGDYTLFKRVDGSP